MNKSYALCYYTSYVDTYRLTGIQCFDRVCELISLGEANTVFIGMIEFDCNLQHLHEKLQIAMDKRKIARNGK